ncbi:MAG: hypothetical protein AAF570_12730, partial [Bacteroidota bacterium]
RAHTIYKLLAGQEKYGFSFNGFRSEDELLAELATQEWKHIGHEVIRFDTWYRMKRNLPV